MVEDEELGCTRAHASHAHADVLKEAIEMIEEMGEELSLSLSVTQAEEDEDEDEREEERGGESAADSSVLTPREATGGGGREKRDADSALGRVTASAPGFRGNKKQRHHQQLGQGNCQNLSCRIFVPGCASSHSCIPFHDIR